MDSIHICVEYLLYLYSSGPPARHRYRYQRSGNEITELTEIQVLILGQTAGTTTKNIYTITRNINSVGALLFFYRYE